MKNLSIEELEIITVDIKGKYDLLMSKHKDVCVEIENLQISERIIGRKAYNLKEELRRARAVLSKKKREMLKASNEIRDKEEAERALSPLRAFAEMKNSEYESIFNGDKSSLFGNKGKLSHLGLFSIDTDDIYNGF